MPRQVRNPCSGWGRLASTALNQAFGVRPDLAGPSTKPFRRPLGVAPVGTWHVLGVRAVLGAHGASLMDGDATILAESNS